MKNYLCFLLLAISFYSCRTTVPLVVHSPEMANTNQVTQQGQVAGSLSYTSNSGSRDEGKNVNTGIQVDSRFAVTNKIFIEGLYTNRNEKVNKTVTTLRNAVPDTFTSSKHYKTPIYNIGIGFASPLNNGQSFFTVAAGWRKQTFNVNSEERRNVNNLQLTANSSFVQEGLYVHPAFQIGGNTVSYIVGAQLNFINFKNIQYNGSTVDQDAIDSLRSYATGTKMPVQFYNQISVRFEDLPLQVNLFTGLNFIQIPFNLRNRALTAGIGFSYCPKIKKNKGKTISNQ